MAQSQHGRVPKFIDAGNSTTTTLAGDAVFTGTAVNCAGFASISVFAYSDVASATNGLQLQLSTDGVNWDREKTVTVAAATSEVHALLVVSKYFRVVYTNGSGAQGEFRLQTILHPSRERALTSGTQQILNKGSDVTLVREVADHALDLSSGLINYQTGVLLSGSNSGVGTSFEDLINQGGTYAGWLEAASAVRIQAGGNINDAAAGTGVQSILVQGLDENFALAQEVLATAGASASSPTTTTFIRVFKIVAVNVGAYGGSNTGAVTLETTGGTVMALMEAGEGVSKQLIYCIPAGKTGYIVAGRITVEDSNTATFHFRVRPNADDVTTPFSASIIGGGEFLDARGNHPIRRAIYTSLAAKTDFWLEAKRISGGGDSEVAALVEIILVDD